MTIDNNNIFDDDDDNTTTPHHNRFTALSPGPPGWAGARRELLDFTVQGKGRLTKADTPTIRLGAIPSALTSAHLHHPPIFFTGRTPFLPPNQQCQSTESNDDDDGNKTVRTSVGFEVFWCYHYNKSDGTLVLEHFIRPSTDRPDALHSSDAIVGN